MKWIIGVMLAVGLWGAEPLPPGEIGVQVTSVVLDIKEYKLVWHAQIWVGGKKKKVEFSIDPDAASMMKGKEKRYFSPKEAAALHELLNMLFQYVVESSFWWEAGKGESKPVREGAKLESEEVL